MQDVNENNGHFETEFTSSEIQNPSKSENNSASIVSGKETTESFSKNWDDNSKKETSREISKPKVIQTVVGIQQDSDAFNFDVNGKYEFKQKNVASKKNQVEEIQPKLRTEVCSESEECDTCMSVLTTLKTMQTIALPE